MRCFVISLLYRVAWSRANDGSRSAGCDSQGGHHLVPHEAGVTMQGSSHGMCDWLGCDLDCFLALRTITRASPIERHQRLCWNLACQRRARSEVQE
ncbi:hypothetical protein B0I35DRAFT_438172 [Stachybotrys elegans]|uniref:Secreted protein n=1 Tax=Stachybotrys elegans TaxID=80388 RepID=A0A8K0WPQ7_9HYPO|nr:hypothetical protein B0I35DRAFT_438172 [Stachybotrys elegans]